MSSQFDELHGPPVEPPVVASDIIVVAMVGTPTVPSLPVPGALVTDPEPSVLDVAAAELVALSATFAPTQLGPRVPKTRPKMQNCTCGIEVLDADVRSENPAPVFGACSERRTRSLHHAKKYDPGSRSDPRGVFDRNAVLTLRVVARGALARRGVTTAHLSTFASRLARRPPTRGAWLL